MEKKAFGFEVKAIDDNTFEGYASVFRNIDSYGDIMEPGAFTKTIQENKRIKVLFNHDFNTPIGKPIHMEEDNHGLYVKAKVAPTRQGQDTLILMREGVIDEMSIGFNTIKDDWNKETGNRHIKEVRLWEFSPVTFAANEQAMITGVKSAAGMQQLLFNLNNELKAGKVLSSKNESLVKSAIEALTALLDATEGKNVEPPNSTQPTPEDEQKAAEDIQKIIAEMRKINTGGYAQ